MVARPAVVAAARRLGQSVMPSASRGVPSVVALAPLGRRMAQQRVAGRAAGVGWAVCRPRHISVRAEPTPNPDSVMFHPGSEAVLGEGTKTIKFTNKYETADSPLAAAIFKVRGVSEVMLASRHVTVTKAPNLEWDLIQPNVELVIGQFYATGLQVVKDGVAERDESAAAATFDPDSLEGQIVDLLEERVRPFVQQDGGDVEFHRFDHDSGAVYLRMHGACSGCPKSGVTLQHGIKNLMAHYIPEVKDVLPADEDAEDLPRPHA